MVTILFSDIVSFTNICAKCRPIDIVNMLNALYIRFDKLTTVHDVYKVNLLGCLNTGFRMSLCNRFCTFSCHTSTFLAFLYYNAVIYLCV